MNTQDVAHQLENDLAHWVEQLAWEALPEAVKEAAVKSVMDGFGVAIAGVDTDSYQRIVTAVQAIAGDRSGRCSVVGSAEKRPPEVAAWLNAAAMHSLDFDDTSFVGVLHPTTVVLPAVWAYAEAVDLDYQTTLVAYIAGVEAMLALAAVYGNQLYERGHWTTSTLGCVGATVGVAKLIGLSAVQIRQSIGLALQMTSAMRSIHGTTAKPYMAGMAARRGIEVAVSVQVGVTAGDASLGGQFGHWNVMGCVPDTAASAMGAPYRFVEPGISFKLYPLCSATQAAIFALLTLQKEYGFAAHEVDNIHCFGTGLVVSCLRYGVPKSVSEAQFSMPFALATVALCGELTLQHLEASWWQSPALQTMAAKVQLEVDAELVDDKDVWRYPEAARVTVQLHDGRKLVATQYAAQGMPAWPLSTEQIRDKFATLLAGQGFTASHTNQLLQKLSDYTHQHAVTDFVWEPSDVQ
ncbi:MAG: MmgE/PrpD family protein [Paenalcaligenes sp.]